MDLLPTPTRRTTLGDKAGVLPALPAGCARLIYVDPPFNTGRVQKRDRMRVTAIESGDGGARRGFAGRRYEVEKVESASYADAYDDFEGFLVPRIEAALRCLTPDGSLFVHLD